VVRLVAARLGAVAPAQGDPLEADATFETMPSVLFDGVVVPDGEEAAVELGTLGHAMEFLKDQYRHCKPLLLMGAGAGLAGYAGMPTDDGDWAVVGDVPAFIDALGRHRNWERAMDPPRV
jgi:catalase